MPTAAVREPGTRGLKVTETVHASPGASERGQLFVWLKSAAATPVTVTPLMARAAVPVLDTVKLWLVLAAPTARVPNARLLALMPTAGGPRHPRARSNAP